MSSVLAPETRWVRARFVRAGDLILTLHGWHVVTESQLTENGVMVIYRTAKVPGLRYYNLDEPCAVKRIPPIHWSDR